MNKQFGALAFFLAIPLLGAAVWAAPATAATDVSPTPPMGWNDWAHYQCDYTAQTVLANAKALVASGLAKRGYDRVTVDDCWMGRKRDAQGNLTVNPKRFPQGIGPVIAAIHRMGLKFGIYEDAGSLTCGGYAGSGAAKPGAPDHFDRDMRQFAQWGVDYVKLDGCNVQSAHGASMEATYRKAYAAASAAIKASGKAMIFVESAPAYFQGQPSWYDVLGWVGAYGQLWREGSDIATFNKAHPDAPRFRSVMWNYVYNRPLGRYQKPGNWNDPDFIIGGDPGMSLAETRSQMALWAMMSAPLVLSVDVPKLSPAAIKVIGNKDVIAVDQDRLGRMATLLQRDASRDVLRKKLADGGYAVAVFNHSYAPIKVDLSTTALGFADTPACTMDTRNLWTQHAGRHAKALQAQVVPGDTAIWQVTPSAACGTARRMGAVVMTVSGSRDIAGHGRCLSDAGYVRSCRGDETESWTLGANGALQAQGKCLALVDGAPKMAACDDKPDQHWVYHQDGSLVNAADQLCLSTNKRFAHSAWMPLQMRACGHHEATQIWSLPDGHAMLR
ncbi:MAG TPA: ricin-type beta-trefoil lectin domain protein [Rhodanobacteraceae bacterium]